MRGARERGEGAPSGENAHEHDGVGHPRQG